jgi:chromosome segregation ATPase
MDMQKQYIDQIEEQLQQWKSDLQTLKLKADVAEARVQKEIRQHINRLEEKQQDAEIKLKELKQAGKESWDDIKAGYEKVRQEIADSIANMELPQ